MAGVGWIPANLDAVDIELRVYKVVLWLVVVPVFCLFTPVYFLQAAVVDGYRICRRLAALFIHTTFKPVEQIRFEGHAFFIVAGVMMLAVITAFALVLFLRLRGQPIGRTLPDANLTRRYRPLPATLQQPIEAKITTLWRMIALSPDRAPATLCFASTSVAACVVEQPAGPAIAISSALLEQLAKPATPLADVILLHEMAHLVGRDARLFRFYAAFVPTFRRTFTVLIVAVGAIAAASSAFELLNVSGIEVRSPSIYAFAIVDLLDLLFPYASMVLVLRYVGLIIMLTELRADLRAAKAVGGLEVFAASVRADAGLRLSPRSYFWRTIVGTRVTHLSAGERLVLMEDANRLLTPKYRYFAWSIALSLLLIFDGSLAFTGFEGGLQFGIIATIAALNAMTVAMVITVDVGTVRRSEVWRWAVMAATVVAANLLLLLDPSDVMGTTGEVFTAFFNPAMHYDADQIHSTVANWTAACIGPIWEAALDGRLALWTVGVFTGFALLRGRSTGEPAQFVAPVVALATAGMTLAIAAAAPFGTYILLPKSMWQLRPTFVLAFHGLGPPAAALIGIALGAALRTAKAKAPPEREACQFASNERKDLR